MTTSPMTNKRGLCVVGGVLLVLVSLWGGAWGWEYISSKDVAFAMAMIYTQIGGVLGGILLVVMGGQKP